MPQQQNHNTAQGGDMSPFDWQLDPIQWLLDPLQWRPQPPPFRRWQLSTVDDADFEPSRQPAGEYIPPFNPPSPLEPTCDPPGVSPGRFGPAQPWRASTGTRACPHDGPAVYSGPQPIFCYHAPPHEGSPGLLGWSGLPGQQHPGHGYFGPYGPPPPPPPPPSPEDFAPMPPPMFYPHPPVFFPPPPMFEETEWFLTDPSPYALPWARPAPPAHPDEWPSMFPTSIASGGPPRPRAWSVPPAYGPQHLEHEIWGVAGGWPGTLHPSELDHDTWGVVDGPAAPYVSDEEPNFGISNVALWLGHSPEEQAGEPESDIWGLIACPDGPADEQAEDAESDTSSVVFILSSAEEPELARRSPPRG